MNSKKRVEQVYFAAVSFALGLILSLTYKTAKNSLANGQLSSQYSQQLTLELKQSKQLNEDLKAQADELEARVSEYEKNASSNDTYVNALFENAKLYRALAGYTDMEGQGLTIEITESKVLIDKGLALGMQSDTDLLLYLRSTLNAAGAEAISMNDLRLTARSEIERAGDHVVINGVATNTPIVVKVIGDSDVLYSALHIPNGMVDRIRKANYNVNIIKEKSVTVPKSRQPNNFIYGVSAGETKE